MKRSIQLRLLSDHHHVRLEQFINDTKTWSLLSETRLEYVNEQALVRWLKTCKIPKKATCSLILNDDCFMWRSFPMCQERTQSDLIFLETVKQEVKWGPHLFIDACIQNNEIQAVTIERAAVQPYLAALKIYKIKPKCIAPAGLLALNVLPWREMQIRKLKLYQTLKLVALPLTFGAIFWSIQYWQNNLLIEAQLQNQRLVKQLGALRQEQSALEIQQILPMLQEALQQPAITGINIFDDGSVQFQGVVTNDMAMDAILGRLKALPLLAPQSLHDLNVQSSNKNQTWRVTFELQGART